MDRSGHFEHERDAMIDAEDAGVEAPPQIGSDERRMHVRAYNYWVSLLNGRAYPSVEDLDPTSLDDFGPNSVLLDFSAGRDNPVIAYLGGALRRECDLEPDVHSLDDVPSRSLLSRLTDHYLQIIANRAPVGFEAEFVNQRGNNTMYRGILMPLSSDNDTIDFVYGVINWKEVAESALNNGLTDEVERALLASPVRHDAPVNLWADGPSAANSENVPPAQSSTHALPQAYEADEDEDAEEVAFDPDGSENLGDWLAAARTSAEAATHADSRSRQFLYRALSLCYDFALVADARPDEYAELLADSAIVRQARAPMTPIVKLVFGIGYDKTRLAEYGMALSYGRRVGIGVGEFGKLIETHPGGLKGMVYAERAERRPATREVSPAEDKARDRAREMDAGTVVEAPGEDEFIVLVARRVDEGHVAVIGAIQDDDAIVQKALKHLTR